MEPRDARLFDLYCDAIEEALSLIRNMEAEGRIISTYANWPELRWHDNGMPWFTHSSFNAPKRYSDALRPFADYLGLGNNRKKEPEFCEFASFRALADYARASPHLSRRLPPDPFVVSYLKHGIDRVVDRYVHLNGTLEFDRKKLLPIYWPLEAFLTRDKLEVIVLVPILFLKVAAKHVNFGNMSVTRLSDSLQLARAPSERHGEYPFVQAAATHALAIYGFEIPNEDWLSVGQATSRPSSFPLDLIEKFFAALRVITGYQTGYGQLLSVPLGWVSDYTAGLRPIEGTSIRRYPPSFENGYRLQTVPTMSVGDLQRVWSLFAQLQSLTEDGQNPRLALAIQRLNSSAIRASEEDGIVDAVVALETLLSEDNQEMTYKVAIRMAALAKLRDATPPDRVFDEVKRVYSLRSAIVHGNQKKSAKFLKTIREGIEVSTTQVAVEYLRTAITVLAEQPQYLDVQRIDKDILLGECPGN